MTNKLIAALVVLLLLVALTVMVVYPMVFAVAAGMFMLFCLYSVTLDIVTYTRGPR